MHGEKELVISAKLKTGFLDKVLSVELVLADCGFNIHATLGCRMAQLRMPAFTPGKSQIEASHTGTVAKTDFSRVPAFQGCISD